MVESTLSNTSTAGNFTPMSRSEALPYRALRWAAQLLAKGGCRG